MISMSNKPVNGEQSDHEQDDDEAVAFVIVSAILDLVLAFVYLKWLHPWKIILQEVCSKFSVAILHNITKEPENWKSDNEQGQNNPVMEKVGRLH